MTFYDIQKKMLISNFQRYRLYFGCNVMTVALFYSFAAIFTNEAFMNPQNVNPMISYNIIAPSVFVGIFLVLFVPYANSVFLRNRKYEYGIFITLGMNEKEVLRNLLMESGVIAGFSLLSGLVIGTVISVAFYLVIQKFIGISDLRWYFNPNSYLVTVELYVITIVFTLLIEIVRLMKTRIIDLLKERVSAEKSTTPRSFFLIIGFASIIISVLVMVIWNVYDASMMWIVSLVFMFVGLFQVFNHMKCFNQKNHIVELSFVRQHKKSGIRLCLITTFLIGFSIFFTGFSFVLYPSLKDSAFSYTPYDMVYSKIFSKNQVEDCEIEKILNQNGVSVQSLKQADFMRDRAFTFLSVTEVNEKFDCSYQVPEGKFLVLYQNTINDGYEYEQIAPKEIHYDCAKETLDLTLAGSDTKILFNDNPTFADTTLLLSDTDYTKIKEEHHGIWVGTMQLYTFDNWKNSQKAVHAVQKYLNEKNQVDKEEERYFKATSRIEKYTTGKQSAEFIIFLMIFIFLLFYTSSNVLIHFKIKSEAEEEKRILTSLYKIGSTDDEMLRILLNKNKYYFMPQVVLGTFLGMFYGYRANESFGYGWSGVMYCMGIGILLTIFQIIMVRKYSKREWERFNI